MNMEVYMASIANAVLQEVERWDWDYHFVF